MIKRSMAKHESLSDKIHKYRGVLLNLDLVLIGSELELFEQLVKILINSHRRNSKTNIRRTRASLSEDPHIVQAMIEIIPGLQGDIPATTPMGVPFVAGKKNVLRSLIYLDCAAILMRSIILKLAMGYVLFVL
ncbi:hypothetical protein CRYUN_Cryun09bG0127200 [Craigia yunnanensis]